MSNPLRHAATALSVVVLLGGLSACGGSEPGTSAGSSPAMTGDDATAAVCRGLAVAHGSLEPVEEDMRSGLNTNEQGAYFPAAAVQTVEFVSRAGVSNDLTGPVAALAGAWTASGNGLTIGIQGSVQRSNVKADAAAWGKVVGACAPYAEIG